jgi:F420H(2)-dependent quinone reductase
VSARRRRVMNALPTIVLRSPLHPLMSSRYLVLTFTGRATGREYSTPVAYVWQGERLVISTDSPWWRNVSDGRSVTMLLRGRTYPGLAARIHDPDQAAAGLRLLVDRIPGHATADLDRARGAVDDAEIARAVAGDRAVIGIDLVAAAG